MRAGGRGRAALAPSLRRLALLYGVQTAHYDFFKRRQEASGDSVLEVTRLLGAPVARADDVPDALRARLLELWQRVVEPVVVGRVARPFGVEVRLPASAANGRLSCSLRLEDGTERRWVCNLRGAATVRAAAVEGARYVAKRLRIPRGLPPGYHELLVDGQGETRRCLVIAAPNRAFSHEGRRWGVFLPLYSLHSPESWGAGDFSDLERLRDWVGRLGGSLVSTLPVLAAHPAEPFDPSPYAPSSRLFWNEFYVDPRRTPELADCRPAQDLLASPPFQHEVASQRSTPHVDYERLRPLRRRVLEMLAGCVAESRNGRYGALREYVASRRALEDYAAFMAVLEQRRVAWPDWPEPLRGGRIDPGDRDEGGFFYHLYVQWLAEQQLAEISPAGGSKPALYLDFPLGVHAHGYDAWRHRAVFALDACGGAPPDAVFTRGQNWQFPPLHPDRLRAERYGYLIACLRHQLAHASFLRIDHVMALHRLYWIPKDRPASEGVYVRYPSDELYAIVCLESDRHRATIVGENLGTVPTHVNAALSRYGIHKMYVVQYEAQPSAARPLKPVPAGAVASLNTHDMPPFAAYLRGMDLGDRIELGLLPEAEVTRERNARERIRRALARLLRREGLLVGQSEDERALTAAVLTWLARSSASVVLVNLEDLWLETMPQNLPGTGTERPNWRHRARHGLEEIAASPELTATIRRVAEERTPAGRRR